MSNAARPFHPSIPWPDPTPAMLNDPTFNAIWSVIKSWDINVPGAYDGYCGATGNHARAILDALMGVQSRDVALANLVREVLDNAPRNDAERLILLPHALADSGWYKRARAALAASPRAEGVQCGRWPDVAQLADAAIVAVEEHFDDDLGPAEHEALSVALTEALQAVLSVTKPASDETVRVTFCYVTYNKCTASCPTREECALGKVMARIDAAHVADQSGVK